MQSQFNNEDAKASSMRKKHDSGITQGQSVEDIDRELHEKLASLGINLSSEPVSGRATQALSPTEEKKTSVLDIAELRSALQQQIGIAEIKKEVEGILRDVITYKPADAGMTQELELKVSALILPYCKEYIPDFPKSVRPSEFAVDLNLQDIIDFHADLQGISSEEVEETVEQYAVQIIQTLLTHPLIPQKEAKKIGVDLKTTALKDERGTAMYSASDAQFLGILFSEQKLMQRSGEVGLLAILISGKKWNKIDSESLFQTAVLYTLEAMAKKRGVPSIILRGQGEDHPIAYILTEYVCHNLDQSLENIVNFIESLVHIAHQALEASRDSFISTVYQDYLPKLKAIFHEQIHESFDRFIEIFRREYQQSQQNTRNRIFFFKRIGDLCELSFYCYEAIRTLAKGSGAELYAKEKLDEGTKHFANRNNIPIDETADFLTQKNLLSELLLSTLKQRIVLRDKLDELLYFTSKLMNDLLFFLDNVRRVFDHSYARGRASSINDYNHWEELVADCSRGYSRLFFGKGLNDIERYHFENIYKRLLETHLSFFDLQTPSIFTPADLKIDNFSKNKRPEDNIKESFLKFFIALHQALLNFDAKLAERPTSQLLNPVQKVSNKAILSSTAALTLDVVQTRAFLSQSEMSLSDYTIETLSAAINPDAKDKVTLIQALRTTVDLSAKARIVDEIKAMKVLLKYLQQRISLLYILNEQEKEQWRTSVNVSLQELEQNDPIAISSYAIILNTIEEWDLSKERILEEWRNPETSILRLHQIMFIILLTKPQNQFYELVDEYKKWLAMNQLPADSIRKRSLDKRFMILRDFLNKGRMRLTFLRLLLVTIQYIQMSYEIKNWEPNPAYIIEDLLAVETPLKKFRQIQTILSTKPSSDVVDLTQKFKDVLMDRFQQSASGYSYYTDEERQLMEKRLRQCENLSHRPDWKNSRDKLIYAVCRLMMRPIRGIAETETK